MCALFLLKQFLFFSYHFSINREHHHQDRLDHHPHSIFEETHTWHHHHPHQQRIIYFVTCVFLLRNTLFLLFLVSHWMEVYRYFSKKKQISYSDLSRGVFQLLSRREDLTVSFTSYSIPSKGSQRVKRHRSTIFFKSNHCLFGVSERGRQTDTGIIIRHGVCYVWLSWLRLPVGSPGETKELQTTGRQQQVSILVAV